MAFLRRNYEFEFFFKVISFPVSYSWYVLRFIKICFSHNIFIHLSFLYFFYTM